VRIRASLAIVLALLGFMVATSVHATRRSRRSEQPRRTQLVSLIRARQHDVDRLSAQLARLRADANRTQRSLLRRENVTSARVKREQLEAGLTDVAGPGVEVVLRDSTRTARDPSLQGALRIRDTDLQLVVNALWSTGAEAVAVNGQRLVATTAIRLAGDTITVNLRPLITPYRVLAVGADAGAFRRTDVAVRFHRWVDTYGLGFGVHAHHRVTVPAFTGRTGGGRAQVVG